MHIWVTRANGKRIKVDVEDSSETIDIKIHGEARKLVLVLDPVQDEVMKIFVSTLKGKTFILEVNGSETIGEVKTVIHEQGGPSVVKQRLLFQGSELDDDITVAGYDIKTDSNLVLMSELCGC